jgi:hypothetical protein
MDRQAPMSFPRFILIGLVFALGGNIERIKCVTAPRLNRSFSQHAALSQMSGSVYFL